MALVLADLLNPQHLTLELRAETRDDALREIFAAVPNVSAKLIEAVIAREEVHTTFMGHGVAFPHARTDLVTQLVLAIGRSSAGVPFGETGELAHLIFSIGVPQRMVSDYLVCVGALARLTKSEATREALMRAETPSDFVDLLRTSSLLLE